VVPHHNYASLPNTAGRIEARRRLRIPRGARVLLVFGAIRNEAERRLVLSGFRHARVPHKVLLVSRWRENLAEVSWIRLKYWLRDLHRMYYRMHPRYHFNYGFVEEKDAQLYLNAADVLLIPRLHVLNSGNVTLGMTFGKVVVGPDSLDVGELLRTTGNVVFDPDRPQTVAAAIEQAMQLAEQGEIGPANRTLALREWSADQCAQRYFDFFSQVLGRRQAA
jgi:glycosyltransferase involved in cell wall biosynthesis